MLLGVKTTLIPQGRECNYVNSEKSFFIALSWFMGGKIIDASFYIFTLKIRPEPWEY